MGLTSVGIGSGMDIAGIVTALVNAESAGKIASFDTSEGKLNAQISGIGLLKSSLSEFQDKLELLTDSATFDSHKVSQSNSDYFKTTVDESAVPGKYQVIVEQLAQSQKVGSAAVADADSPIGEGSLSIGVGSDSFDIEVGAEDSLTDIMEKINAAEDNDGVTATIINGDNGPQLILGSKNTGTDNLITVTATDTDGGTGLADAFAMTELTPALDAILTVDGVKVTSSSNDVSDIITGVSLELTDADIGKTTTITVDEDTDKASSAIEGFVESYNALMTTIQDLSRYDAATENAAILQGDPLPRSLQSQLRNIISSSFETSSGSGSQMLMNIGITTTREGLLEIDDDKLSEAIEADKGGIKEMFITEDTGLASRLDTFVDSYLEPGGIIDGRNDTIDNQLSRLEDSREALDLKMSAYSDRLYKQFNAMDLVVASLNSQSSSLFNAIDSLPGVVKKT
ncbi:flagellar filament capping protein FliD [Shewanella sp. 10N.286.52.B9]|uniref:flagellar filament capping protein FliD n=1 Tax=Shewanella sp. 10N.286.52.B9 TaxID=1880837 RepID=UPI000C827306|nr:flagellar filament capping protein FliD [Shewanella sp. 10N.286.52.B9]PMG41957.1 flagellar hook protein FliD [Shewanella sp. 10N.286.52.B9]